MLEGTVCENSGDAWSVSKTLHFGLHSKNLESQLVFESKVYEKSGDA